MSEYLPGARIRYTMGNIGVIGKWDANVNEGDLGTVLGPAPSDLPDGWLFTEPDAYPQSICPVAPTMVEAVAS